MSGKRSTARSRATSPRAAQNVEGHDDEDSDEEGSGSVSGSKTTSKRRRTSAAQENNGEESSRKAQNRISQRESRQRKALHTQQLEREVALYKLTSDDRLHSLLITIGLFIEENAKIRQMLAQLSSFIGDSGGGVLASRGINLDEIRAASLVNDREWIFNKADEIRATVRESKTQPDDHKGKGKANKAGDAQTANGAAPDTSVQSTSSALADSNGPMHLPVPVTDLQTVSSLNDREDSAPSPDLFAQLFQSSELLPPDGHTYMPASATPLPSGSSGQSPHTQLDLTSYSASSWPPYQAVPLAPSPLVASNTLNNQASQLTNYHLRSRNENPFHTLPAALEPTLLQNMLPHDVAINGVLWPSIRDKLITAQNGQNPLHPAALIQELEAQTTVHPGLDLLDPAAREVSESFIRKYPWLVDLNIVAASNKWRTMRGEPEIVP